MAYRKKTMRAMPPLAKKLSKLANDHASMGRRLKNLIKEVKDLEIRQAKIDNEKEVLNRIKGD